MCDMILLYFLKHRKYYKDQKFLELVDEDFNKVNIMGFLAAFMHHHVKNPTVKERERHWGYGRCLNSSLKMHGYHIPIGAHFV